MRGVDEMDKEKVRLSLNVFLKLYFDSCREVYQEINFDRITHTQFKYLKKIHQKGEVTLTELSQIFNTSKPTINEVINKLLQSKIVKKRKSETDKRVSFISLTEVGEVLATTNKLESQRMVQNLMSQLTEEEVATLIDIFDKLGSDNS